MEKIYNGKCLYIPVWTVIYAWFLRTFLPKLSVNNYTLKREVFAEAFLPGYKKECAIIDGHSSIPSELASFVEARKWSGGVVLYAMQKYNITISVTTEREFDAVLKVDDDYRIFEGLKQYTPPKEIMLLLLRKYDEGHEMRKKILATYPYHFCGLATSDGLTADEKWNLCVKGVFGYSQCLPLFRENKELYAKFFDAALQNDHISNVKQEVLNHCLRKDVEFFDKFVNWISSKNTEVSLVDFWYDIIGESCIGNFRGVKMFIPRPFSATPRKDAPILYEAIKKVTNLVLTVKNISKNVNASKVQLVFELFYDKGDKDLAKEFITKFNTKIWLDRALYSSMTSSFLKKVADVNPCLKNGVLLKNVLFEEYLNRWFNGNAKFATDLFPYAEYSPDLQIRALRWLLALQKFPMDRFDELSSDMKVYENELLESRAEIEAINKSGKIGAKQMHIATELACIISFHDECQAMLDYIAKCDLHQETLTEMIVTDFNFHSKIVEFGVLNTSIDEKTKECLLKNERYRYLVGLKRLN